MSVQNPFADEWRECLREHYKYIIREQDRVTERSLLTVMHEVGFDDAELAELRVLATMRAEDMPEDYIPEAIYQTMGVDLPSTADYPAEPQADDDLAYVQEAAVIAPVESEEAAPEDEDDAPKQMSLF